MSEVVGYPDIPYGVLGPEPWLINNVLEFGAVGDGVTDDTAAIQAAMDAIASAGGVIYIPQGTFKFSGPMLFKSGTTIAGTGTIKAAPIGEWLGSDRIPPFTVMPGSPFFGLVNKNHDASTIIDENITIRGITIDYTDLPTADGTRHCIYIRKARRVVIEGVTILGGSSSIALLACDDTQEIGNRLVGFSNCGSDHWDGARNARVVGCYIEATTIGQMVNWNPDPTLPPSTGVVAEGFVFTGNIIVCTSDYMATIFIAPIRTGGIVRNVVISDNELVNCQIVVRANVSGCVISNNNMSGFVGGLDPISGYAWLDGTPTAVVVEGNVIRNPLTTVTNVAVIRMQFPDVVISGNLITGDAYDAAPVFTGNPSVGIIIGNFAKNKAVTNRLPAPVILSPANNNYYGWTDSAGFFARQYLQVSDDNWIFSNTNATGGQRTVFSMFARSNTSELIASVPMQFASPIRFAIASIIAAGTTFINSTVLTNNVCVVTTATAGVADGVRLPDNVGRPTEVWNQSGVTINVFPNTLAAAINGGAPGASVTILNGAMKTFRSLSATDARVIGEA